MDWDEKSKAWVKAEAEIEAAHINIANELLRRAALKPGQNVLDIGCGSGGSVLNALAAVGPDGTVTGADIAPPLIARGAARTADQPNAAFLTGDAQTFPFEAAKYDAIISLFGMMFFADPAAALANIRTALRPARRITFVAWAGRKHNPWFALPRKAVEAVLSNMPSPKPGAPGPMAFADGEWVTELLDDAGWKDASVDVFDSHLTPPGGTAETAEMLSSVGPSADLIRANGVDRAEAARMGAAIKAHIAESFEQFKGDKGLRVPCKVHFYSASA